MKSVILEPYLEIAINMYKSNIKVSECNILYYKVKV